MSTNETSTVETSSEVVQKAKKPKKQRKKMNKTLKRVITLIILALVAFGIFKGVRYASDMVGSKNDITQNLTGFASYGRIETFISGWGTVAPKQKEELGQTARGTVGEVFVASGDVVNVGDVLFNIDTSDIQTELDDALDTLDDASVTLNAAQSDLNNLNIKTPYSGKLIAFEDINVGDSVYAGQTIGTYVDDNTLSLSLYFSYAYIDDIKVGQSATVSIPDSMTNTTGIVSEVKKVKKITSDGAILFNVTIELSNPGALTKGMTAIASINTATGTATPYESSTLDYSKETIITAKVAGEILAINADEYMEYSNGHVLVNVDGTAAENAVKSAQRSYDTAKEAADELTDLINDSAIISTMTGVVTAIVVSPGDTLNAGGTPLITISDLSSMVLNVEIDEMDISKATLGMPVTITSETSDGYSEVYGTLSSVSFEANAGSSGGAAYFPAVITFDNFDNSLMPGMGVTYKISANLREYALYVPNSAIVYAESGAAVYVKPQEGETFETILDTPESTVVPEGFVLVPVEIGIADAQNTEIISGLYDFSEVYLASATTDPYGYGGYGGTMIW